MPNRIRALIVTNVLAMAWLLAGDLHDRYGWFGWIMTSSADVGRIDEVDSVRTVDRVSSPVTCETGAPPTVLFR